MASSEATPTSNDQFVLSDAKLVVFPGLEEPDFELTASVANPYARRRFHIQADGTRGEFSSYIPHLTHISDATLRQLPPFIFRVTHAESAGINEVGHFQSEALRHWGPDGKVNFFSLPRTEQIRQLDDHVSQFGFNSHWISFTDSPLTAICRALQHIRRGRKDIRLHVINTLKITNPALIVSSYAMLRGYRVCVDLNPVEQKKMLGSSYAEFLVWDELIAEATMVRFSELLSPPNSDSKVYVPGLLDLVPGLLCPSKDKRLKFRQAWRLRETLYGLEQRIEAKLEMFRPCGPRSRYRRQDWAGRYGAPKHCQRQDVYDPRRELDDFERSKFDRLVDGFPDEYKIVMLTFFLSLKTNLYYEESIVDQIVQFANGTSALPRSFLTSLQVSR